ncbi:signal recognition particle subunit SRP54 2-like isoform X2 [Vicia villosa]|uniref:signal recognition particle subunit SRP54 2-like isoform X2 n=1 Tax=Vicia villosa TaxID=3911 RepID=UPI00273AD9E7|nr:signal recognition particle subunit SRP54 2-like isoform X2 [Vicia villosa]
MVLAQLCGSISRALQQMSNATIIDEKVLDECLNEISHALVQSDVQIKLVRDMQTNIKNTVNLADAHSKRRIIHQALFNELCSILDPGKPSFTPKKGKASVVMFVGLKGSGKTTTCTKYAFYHQRKGWKPALVCADTFRAGAFDHLKQNATIAKIPFYGSYMESDPVKIAVEGVERFRKENCDLIIVDTSGRNKQEAAFFEEMCQVSEATKPDLVIFVIDSSIGQAAFDQAQAFKQSAAVGAVIITKMDGHAKGGGALSAVAATKSPVIFIGTGEHMDEFEVFDVKPFVNRLLGMGDSSGFVDQIHEVVTMDQQPELPQMLSEGHFTLRVMNEQFQKILKMDPIGQEFSMLPGFSSIVMRKAQLYMTMMDSMTNEELDSSEPQLMSVSQMIQIAQDSGRQVREVLEMMEVYKGMAKIRSKVKEHKTLAELGGSISRALQQMSNATIIDENVLDECLNKITSALVQSDVQYKLIRDMLTNIKNIVNLADGHNKRSIIHQAVFNELCNILDPGKPSFTLKKGKASVVMVVGLQGSGKTTTCTKYAFYHQRKGWRPALVCADTFRAGAFDQLKQNATTAKVPFYGRYVFLIHDLWEVN